VKECNGRKEYLRREGKQNERVKTAVDAVEEAQGSKKEMNLEDEGEDWRKRMQICSRRRRNERRKSAE